MKRGHVVALRAVALVLLAVAVPGAGCARHARRTTIRFWGMGREGEVVQELIPDFERENPGVHVVVGETANGWETSRQRGGEAG